MRKYFLPYLATFFSMVLIDMVWLGLIAKPIYQSGIGHLMADSPNIVAAVLFYILYPMGIVLFVVAQHGPRTGLGKTFFRGVLLGLFAYGTYDLTNLATLKDWPVSLAAIDMAWGALVTGISAVAGSVTAVRMRASH